VVVGDEGGVRKLQRSVGKLEVGSIGVKEGREGVLHGEQGGSSGRRSSAVVLQPEFNGV
jgi:hypothetical protein